MDDDSRLGFDLGSLTTAERRVFDIALSGEPVKGIAAQLVVSEATVATHLSRIYAKLGVRGRAELLSRVVATGQGAADARRLDDRQAQVGSVGGASDRWWTGVAASLLALAAGIFVPLTSIATGPGLMAVALLSGERVFGRARPAVLAVAVLLIAEGLFVLTIFRVG